MKKFIVSMTNRIFLSLFLLFPLLSSSQSLKDLTFGTDSTLEVITWNIEWFPKNGQTTADSVKTIIEALDADVIGFQEIDDTALFRQVINQVPGYKLHIEPGYFAGLAYAYRSASVFAKSFYKIYDTQPYWNAFPRAPVVMEFLFKGEEYIAINNHYKCCGDGNLDVGNTSDEENRRYLANTLLKEYIDSVFSEKKVFLIGDLNDELDDDFDDNVFRDFILDGDNYYFADDRIAKGPIQFWSYPSWPSHLDHILISKELFENFEHPNSICETILVDGYLSSGFGGYDNMISDHRPVGIKLITNLSTSIENQTQYTKIQLFPNPTDGNFQLKAANQVESFTVEVFDFSGKLIFTKKVVGSTAQIKLDIPSGLYLVFILAERQRFSQKVVIK